MDSHHQLFAGLPAHPIADPRPTDTDAGKVLSFSAAGPVNCRRWRLPGMQTCDLRLLKTPKTATVVSTPLAIWWMSDKTALGEGPIQWN